MGNRDAAPEHVLIEFSSPSGRSITLGDLGTRFMADNNVSEVSRDQPFRVAAFKKGSMAGNGYYDYSQNAVPLPHGLETFVRVAGVIIPMGKVHPSRASHPTRRGCAQIIVGNMPYTVTVYLTESKQPCFVKVIAHKTPNTAPNLVKAMGAPRGGHVVV